MTRVCLLALLCLPSLASAGPSARKASKREPSLRPQVADPSVEALSGFEFQALKLTVKDAHGPARMSVLQKTAGNARFSSDQTSELLGLFPSAQKLKVLQWLQPRLTDPDKASTIVDHVGAAERGRARDILRRSDRSAVTAALE